MKKQSIYWLIASLFSMLLMIGCKSNPQYIPVESVKLEFRDRLVKDYIHTRDSVIISKNGDTLKIRETSFVDRYYAVHDSIFINDTIRVPVIVPGETIYINKLAWWQTALIWTGAITLILIIAIVAYKIKKPPSL